jgi:hypothetical protein
MKLASALVTGVALAVATAASAAPMDVIQCTDLNAIAAVANGAGFNAQLVESEGVRGLIMTAPNGLAFIALPIVLQGQGCFAIAFGADFGPDDGSHLRTFHEFNGSPDNGFFGVATTIDGRIATARSVVARYGLLAGNLDIEFKAFALSATNFAQKLGGGVSAKAGAPASGAKAIDAKTAAGTVRIPREVLLTIVKFASDPRATNAPKE